MTEEVVPESAQKTTPAFPLVSIRELQAIDFEQPIRESMVVDPQAFDALFSAAARAETEAGNEANAGVFALLANLCGFHFKPQSRGEAYGPMMTQGDRRTAIPDDFRGEQTSALSEIAPAIKNPALRARIADVAWLNNRSDRAAAEIAITAYLECIERLLDGRAPPRFDMPYSAYYEALEFLVRGCQISSGIRKRGEGLSAAVINVGRSIWAKISDLGLGNTFVRVAKTLLRWGIVEPDEIISKSQPFLDNSPDRPDAHDVRAIHELRALAFKEKGDSEGENKARLAAAEELVSLSAVSTGMLSSHWLMEAIKELRRIPGTQARRREVEALLSQKQGDTLDSMSLFSQQMDLSDLVSHTLNRVGALPLSVALGQFADLSRSRSVEDLRKEALNSLNSSPLSSMMPSETVDDEGRVTYRNPGASLGQEEQPDEWMKHMMCRNESLHRSICVAGQLEPARHYIRREFPVAERHFAPIVLNSGFVPPEHRAIFAAGFSSFMQGDFLTATHLLVPQIENSVRHVLRLTGIDPSIIQADLIQEDQSLSAILDKHREAMEAVFGAAITNEIDLLFNHRAGPALRHEMAHGKVSGAQCNSTDCVYACWFIYRLTCIPLFRVWDDVAKAIEDTY